MSHAAEPTSPKHTNALAKQTSPYLLQHAHNPVDWHPWGEEAFALARKLDKPIFLSVGYSTCYWCHVMERQCFENEAIAAIMNEHFVNIKVDREERPDVDDIYMTAVQLMTQRGGWPMSVFLTPDLKPFWAGTYIPPEPRYGMPSFPQVLRSLSDAWKDQRHEVLAQARRVTEAVTEHLNEEDTSGELSVALVQQAANQLMRRYDAEHGGFGGAPKFPQASNLLLLMAVQRNNPNDQLAKAIAHTLDRMARGGIYDQVGGGFHRYSTDPKWLVPHFEKMLYDNGQLLEVYAKWGGFEATVRQTCEYVLREMTDASGAFWSAQDAEVEALEGGNYLWDFPGFTQALGDEKLADLAVDLYGINLGPNFQDPHHPDAPAGNVLFRPLSDAEFAARHKLGAEELSATVVEINRRLLAVRDGRKQPGTDDKVLTAWNGMMIAGLAVAGRTLGEARYVAAADRAAEALLTQLRAADGSLLRTMRGGRAAIPAFLEDYAFLMQGLLELHRATGQPRRLEQTLELLGIVQERFADPRGGYFDTLAGQRDLFVRTRTAHDGAIPSGNSRMAHNLLDLFELTRDEAHLARAATLLGSFGGKLQTLGANMAHMQHALLRALELGVPAADPRRVPAIAASGPVTLRLEPNPVKLDQPFSLTLAIAKGHHLNAHDLRDRTLIPTTLSLHEGKGYTLEVVYPPGAERYEGRVVLRGVVRAEAGATGSPTLVLRYQACTGSECLAPREVELPLVVD